MDRGVPTEAVLEEMRAADPPVQYLVGTPKGRLTRLEQALLVKPWHEARPRVKVKLLPQDGELYVFAQSADRIAKERAPCAAGSSSGSVGAPCAVARDGARARCAAHEAWQCTEQSTRGLAPDRYPGGRKRRHLQLPAQSRPATQDPAPRRPLSTTHQPDRDRSGQAVELLPAAGHRRRSIPHPEERFSPFGRSSIKSKHASKRTCSLPSSPTACTSLSGGD